ncbi:hypothetical protein MM808_30070, partial [Klebsiella pneumoniae]|nr:hypothetical protein [Klebsiella pneumoniae]
MTEFVQDVVDLAADGGIAGQYGGMACGVSVLDSAETQNFAAEANAETRARFLNNDKARALSDGILNQMQDTRKIPFCQEHRARMYHFHQDAE